MRLRNTLTEYLVGVVQAVSQLQVHEFSTGPLLSEITFAINTDIQRLERKTRSTHTNKSSAVAEMGDRLATIDMDRKDGGAPVPLSGGDRQLGPI